MYEKGRVGEMKESRIDIIEYIIMFKKGLWILITLPLIFSLLSLINSDFRTTRMYQADSTIYVMPEKGDGMDGVATFITNDDMFLDLRVGEYLVNDYRELIRRRLVLNNVLESLNLTDKITPNELSSLISVNVLSDTRIIRISVRNKDPQLAKLLTNRVTEVLVERAPEIVRVENINIIDTAEMPTSPIPVNKRRNLVIAFLTGLGVAVGLIFVLDYLEYGLKRYEQEIYGYLQSSSKKDDSVA